MWRYCIFSSGVFYFEPPCSTGRVRVAVRVRIQFLVRGRGSRSRSRSESWGESVRRSSRSRIPARTRAGISMALYLQQQSVYRTMCIYMMICVCVALRCSVAGLRSDGAGTGDPDPGQRRRLDLRTGVRQRSHQPAGHRQNEPSDTSRRRHLQRCVRTAATLPRCQSSRKRSRLYSISERRVPELIPVLCSQPAADVSHKPGGRLP